MMPTALENALYGMLVTPALYSVERHGVFTCLIEHGPASAESLAAELGLDRETLDRMLLLLAALGVLSREEGGNYALPSPVCPLLDPRDGHYIGGLLAHLAGDTATRLDRLDGYLARGKPTGGASPFAEIYRDEKSLRAFMAAMWDLSFAVSTELVSLAGFEDTDRLVDVGGATGPFAVAALRAASRLNAIVFDVPEVGPLAREAARIHGLADRLKFVGGDFFTEELPVGDCLAFGYVLSDWDDETCLELLRKAYRACLAPGRVLIMDRLFNDDYAGPLSAAAMNLVMHIEMAGRHRTAAEFVALLEGAGFTRCEVRRSSGEKHLIIGYKADFRESLSNRARCVRGLERAIEEALWRLPISAEGI